MTAGARAARRVGRLRAVPRPVRRVARRRRRRGGRAARRQRRRQDHRRPGGDRAGRARPAGRCCVDGDDLTGRAAHRFARAGVAHAPEGRSVFATADGRGEPRALVPASRGAGRASPAALDQAFELFPVLGRAPPPAGRHPVRRRAADAVDGPGAGRGAQAARRRRAVARAWRRSSSTRSTPASTGSASAGTSLLIVEQHVGHALALCDRVVLLDHGAVSWEGSPADAGDRVVTKVFEH